MIAGVAFGGLGTVALMSTQIFPMIDPFIILLFVQELDEMPCIDDEILIAVIVKPFPDYCKNSFKKQRRYL